MTANLGKTAAPARPSTPEVAMSDGRTRVVGPLLQARPNRARTAAAVIAMALPAVLGLAACGGGPPARQWPRVGRLAGPSRRLGFSGSSNSSSSGSPDRRALAFAQCVRHHGVPNFPDPNSSGNFPQRGTDRVEQPPPVPGGPDCLQ